MTDPTPDLPGRTNSELEADVERLTAERDEARTALAEATEMSVPFAPLEQVGWVGPHGGFVAVGEVSDPAPNWAPVYRFAAQEATDD